MKRLLLIFILFPQFLVAQFSLTIHPGPPKGEFRGFRYREYEQLNRPKVGLVLSGGGARGLAQIGVLRALEEKHIPVDLIVGNSLGSVVGGLYASGYTTTQLESIATHVNWDQLLSFAEPTNRTDLFVGQKQTGGAGFLSVRFDGLQPVIPQSISGGQHITNFFMSLTLQALYHPDSTFDDLKIPFRSVATDLYRGRRVVLDRGSLAEAMRASITVPFLYTPLERDSMALVDGGLLSNIPVDIARSMGCDIVIVVNSTSELQHETRFGAPWEVADQIMTIMMQSANEHQLADADIVITPPLKGHGVSEFTGIDTLIFAGRDAAMQMADSLRELIRKKSTPVTSLYGNRVFPNVSLAFAGDSIPGPIRAGLEQHVAERNLGVRDIEESISQVYATGDFSDASCTINETRPGSAVVTYNLHRNAPISDIVVSGLGALPAVDVYHALLPLQGTTLNGHRLAAALERVLETYRAQNLSLARVDSVGIDSAAGVIRVAVNEGVLSDIKFEGNERTKDYVLRRELPYDANTIFNLDKVYTGMVNVVSTGLFEYALLNVRYDGTRPYVVIKVKEKPSETLLLGLHGDNEHGLVSTITVGDANFRGAGDELDLSLRYGLRDRLVRLGYRANRIFQTYLTFDLKGFYSTRDIYTYMDDPNNTDTHWDRVEQGRYRENRYGGIFSFGTQVERLGSVTADIRAAHHYSDPLSGTGYTADSYNVVALKLQTTVDTENKFVFPTEGVFFNGSYEVASKKIGSGVPFNKFGMTYESYHTIAGRHTFHPRLTFGFADQTLPVAEQYSLGGFGSFFGLAEDDSRGRQLFLVNMEYRFFAPFRILFDTYLGVRYDVGTISAVPQELKFSTFRHGVGATLSLDTPLGSASFGGGFSFLLRRNIPNEPLSYGPFMLYFSIGPTLTN